MKKIGIISIYDNNNYGNRLQNYALQRYLEGLDEQISAESIINYTHLNEKKNYFLRYIKYFKRRNLFSDNKGRKKNFVLFNKFIKYSKKKYTYYSKKLNYDFIVVGSDQVWNPKFGRLRDADLLSFLEPNKRIAYAASFGIENLPENNKEKSSLELLKFKSISVREDRGKEIVEELTCRKDIEVLIDPTMLLTSEEWDKVSKKPKILKNDKYILNYFLGNLSNDRKTEIERIAKENNCEIINILDKNSPFYECGPSEFLYLEKNAFLICTDSFHSSVFAILYNSPFLIFDREQEGIANMGSRIDTLLTKFKLEDRKFEGKITKENLNHDYSEAYKILEIEREKSKKFLEKALDLK